MTLATSTCPGCGALLQFKNAATLVVVCPFCNSSSRRAGQKIELIGKVAEVAPIASPFTLGSMGRIKNVSWTIVGQVQLDHGRGPWNEWCISLGDGSWAWLAEAQGEYYITRALPEDTEAPDFDQLKLEGTVPLSGDDFVVTEIGTGTIFAARGELPFELRVGEAFKYADLDGPNEGFATIDYGSGNVADVVYKGRSYTFEELGFDAGASPAPPVQGTSTSRIACPSCGASIVIQDINHAKRAGCESCGAIMDPRSTDAKVLSIAERYKQSFVLPIGGSGEFRGQRYDILAFIERSVRVEGVRYRWGEYLLRRGDGAYRWLSEVRGHWSFITPVNRAKVIARKSTVQFNNMTFKHFTSGNPRVDVVVGEVYWEVFAGETVSSHDYICPPYVLTREKSDNEWNVSVGEYVSAEEIVAAFKPLARMPAQSGVGMNQPNPWNGYLQKMLKFSAICASVVLALVLFFNIRAAREVVYQGTSPILDQYAAAPAESAPGASDAGTGVFYTDEFDIPRDGNLEIRISAHRLVNGWLGINGALINSETGDVDYFGAETGFWTGSDSDGAWSEGNSEDTVYVGPVPKGRYSLRLDPETDIIIKPPNFSVRVRSQVASVGRPIGLILLPWLLPLIALILKGSFEARRWSESDYA